MSENEVPGIDLLLSEPEIVAWLELDEGEDDDARRRRGTAPSGEGDAVHSRVVEPRHGPTLLVRPLRRGDIDTVIAVFERLGEDSRRKRFIGWKPRLGEKELRWLAAVDSRHHALVAYVEGDPRPVAIARLVRSGSSAEIAFEVADEYQRRGIGTVLTAELLADACAAGIAEITALVSSDNRAALALLRRALKVPEVRVEGGALSIRAAIPCPSL